MSPFLHGSTPFNIVSATDSYKWTHPGMLRPNTTGVYSYGGARGGPYEFIVNYGLQIIRLKFLSQRVQPWMIDEAEQMHRNHFVGGNTKFHRKDWEHILNAHDGRLPLRIMARPEGKVSVPGQISFTVENTDPACRWLTNHVEPLLLHTWYPTTVASVSFSVRQTFRSFVGDDFPGLAYMLHDFGYRGVSTHEGAGIGGSGHLLSFRGTDTLEAMREAHYHYAAPWENLAHSIPATEHSIMTQDGVRYSDIDVLEWLIPLHANGLLSAVGDSYDYPRFVRGAITLRPLLQHHKVKVILRPDSMTEELATPSDVILWTLREFQKANYVERDTDGLFLIDPSYGIIWGDGLSPDEIRGVLQDVVFAGFSAKNIVFGMGGGLLQKVNRDTQKWAVKSSAQARDGVWHDVFKETPGKPALRGRFDNDPNLELVYENGENVRLYTFDEVRANLMQAESNISVIRAETHKQNIAASEMFTGTN